MVKVEEGLCDGQVLYHKYVQRSKAEAAAQQSEVEAARALKEQRRRQQVGDWRVLLCLCLFWLLVARV